MSEKENLRKQKHAKQGRDVDNDPVMFNVSFSGLCVVLYTSPSLCHRRALQSQADVCPESVTNSSRGSVFPANLSGYRLELAQTIGQHMDRCPQHSPQHRLRFQDFRSLRGVCLAKSTSELHFAVL